MSRKSELSYCLLTALCTKEHHQRAHGARIKLAEALDPVGLRITRPHRTPRIPAHVHKDLDAVARVCVAMLPHAPLMPRSRLVAWLLRARSQQAPVSAACLETSAAKQWTDVGASGRIRNSLHFGTNFLTSLQKRLCQKPCGSCSGLLVHVPSYRMGKGCPPPLRLRLS